MPMQKRTMAAIGGVNINDIQNHVTPFRLHPSQAITPMIIEISVYQPRTGSSMSNHSFVLKNLSKKWQPSSVIAMNW